MSDEMAVSNNTSGDEPQISDVKVEAASTSDAVEVTQEPPTESEVPQPEAPSGEPNESKNVIETEVKVEVKEEDEDDIIDDKRSVKRRASTAFSDNDNEEFKGFEVVDQNDSKLEYSRVLERMEAEVSAARDSFTPVKHVMATPPVPVRANKKPRQDTDGSRPSSALSSRSDGDAAHIDTSQTSSPVGRGRRVTTEMSSPLLRVPLERGWRRELVYRAALDAHSRRNADIYYYTPQGKKLRSTREIAENLSGTGLTLENFSFFKEPLGIDDPEREIIRDAKVIRRVESPVSSPAPPVSVEGKRTPKPKPPKGASPEPVISKSPPAKIKVKSVGARLSNNSASAQATAKQPQKKPPTAADNNNTATWKKPRQPAPAASPTAPPAVLPAAPSAGPAPTPPPPLQSRPATHPPPPALQAARQLVQPCSMSCGRGAVPSLACAACLCLYHPACVGVTIPTDDSFLCKNCRKTTSPPLEPPPLTHKSGVTAAVVTAPAPVPAARRLPAPVPVPVPVPVPAKVPRQDKRVTLRMKVSGGGPDGERVWAVARPPARAPRAHLPQSVAVIKGKRFIVVPRTLVSPPAQAHH